MVSGKTAAYGERRTRVASTGVIFIESVIMPTEKNDGIELVVIDDTFFKEHATKCLVNLFLI
jgi:hypothetical protein